MSEENVEVVREVITLMNAPQGDELDPRLLELFAPEVEVDVSRRLFKPDVYQGHAGLARLRREVEELWGTFLAKPERFMDVGESVIVIEIAQGRGRGSVVTAETQLAVIWTVRRGKVIRMEVGLDPQEALELVRLREIQ
jgi:ketosteroid isomerase-like protein